MPTVTLIGTPVYKEDVIPPGATAVGTRRVFSEDLRDKNSNKHVGQHSGTGTLVRKGEWWLMHAGWTLDSVGSGAGKTGTLIAGGLFDFSPNGSPPFMAAIFGGTGDFDTVRGEIAATPLANDEWGYRIEFVP